MFFSALALTFVKNTNWKHTMMQIHFGRVKYVICHFCFACTKINKISVSLMKTNAFYVSKPIKMEWNVINIFATQWILSTSGREQQNKCFAIMKEDELKDELIFSWWWLFCHSTEVHFKKMYLVAHHIFFDLKVMRIRQLNFYHTFKLIW